MLLRNVYGLRAYFFNFMYNEELKKTVEATVPVIPYDIDKMIIWASYGRHKLFTG